MNVEDKKQKKVELAVTRAFLLGYIKAYQRIVLEVGRYVE